MEWQNLAWPPPQDLYTRTQGACGSLALGSLAHPLLPFLLLFSSSLCGWPKSKNKRETAAIKMEKRGGGSGGGGVPKYYQPKSWDGKGKGKRQRGRQPRQTDGSSTTEVWPAVGCRGRCGNPWICSLFTPDGGFWEEKQEHREPVFSFLQLLTNISSPAAAVMKILGKQKSWRECGEMMAGDRSRLQPWLRPLLAVCPGASFLTFLGLSFPNYEIWKLIVPVIQGGW